MSSGLIRRFGLGGRDDWFPLGSEVGVEVSHGGAKSLSSSVKANQGGSGLADIGLGVDFTGDPRE